MALRRAAQAATLLRGRRRWPSGAGASCRLAPVVKKKRWRGAIGCGCIVPLTDSVHRLVPAQKWRWCASCVPGAVTCDAKRAPHRCDVACARDSSRRGSRARPRRRCSAEDFTTRRPCAHSRETLSPHKQGCWNDTVVWSARFRGGAQIRACPFVQPVARAAPGRTWAALRLFCEGRECVQTRGERREPVHGSSHWVGTVRHQTCISRSRPDAASESSANAATSSPRDRGASLRTCTTTPSPRHLLQEKRSI
jgi:hypothetical protein